MSEAIAEPIYEGMVLPTGLSLPVVQIEEYPDIPASEINSEPQETPEIKATPAPAAIITPVLKSVMSAAQYHEITKTLAALVPEVRMHISVLGLKVLAVDTANVAMVLYDQYAGSFDSFESTTKIDLGVDIAKWMNFGKQVSKKSLVVFEVFERQDPPTPDQVKNEKKPGTISHHYTLSSGGSIMSLKGLDCNTIRKDPHPPTISLPTEMLITASTFIEAIKTCKTISDKINFVYDGKDQLTAIAQGDTDKMVKQILFDQSIGPAFNSLFSLDYLNDIAKSIQNKKEVLEVSFNTDHPIKIKMVNSEREIVFLLAPRIQAD